MNRDHWQLRTAARNYYDAYRLATRINNRLKALAREGDTYNPTTEPLLIAQLDSVKAMKEDSGKLLVKLYRSSAPQRVIDFQQETLGLGEIWMARLIGEVGDFVTYTEAWWGSGAEAEELSDGEDRDPALNDDDDDDSAPLPKRVLMIGEVKTTGVRELWAYCGHGNAERRRRRGQTQAEALSGGNPTAKMVVHQMTEFALRLNGQPDKNGKERGMTPYYPAYLAARKHAEELHPDWRPGHVYNYAVRKAGKEILRDLWRIQHGYKPVYGDHSKLPPWVPKRPLEAADVA